MPITMLDGILIIFSLISATLAMIRGLSRELFSIACWATSAASVYFFYQNLTPYIEMYIKNQEIAMIVSALFIFLVTLIVLTVITMKIADIIVDSCIGALDRTLGFIYGLMRGVLVVAVGLFFFTWISGDHQPVWIKEAKSRALLENTTKWLEKFVPEISKFSILEKIIPLKAKNIIEEKNFLSSDKEESSIDQSDKKQELAQPNHTQEQSPDKSEPNHAVEPQDTNEKVHPKEEKNSQSEEKL